jgi:hypothetical protein
MVPRIRFEPPSLRTVMPFLTRVPVGTFLKLKVRGLTVISGFCVNLRMTPLVFDSSLPTAHPESAEGKCRFQSAHWSLTIGGVTADQEPFLK